MKRAGSLTIHVVAEADPPFAVFEGWGPRTSKVHPSHRTRNLSHSMFTCRGAFIATTDQDTCTASLPVAINGGPCYIHRSGAPGLRNFGSRGGDGKPARWSAMGAGKSISIR